MADRDALVGFPRKCQLGAFLPLGASGPQPEVCGVVPRTGHLCFSLAASMLY